ncbi:interferon-induced very large GTPase 1-like [Engraulis encrasicolus]|uniref:interferon-induced very large GTPase 1-like n=1 Tax=Engraulis encrasicolus TaxID=184585 RepID=UPI002FD07456
MGEANDVPGNLAVSYITASSARISWQVPTDIQETPHSFLVSYQSEGTEAKIIATRISHVLLSDLRPATDYTVDIYTELQNGEKSQPTSVHIKTDIPAPQCPTVRSITASSVRISWQVPMEMQKTPHRFLVSYQSEGSDLLRGRISTEYCSTNITGLTPGAAYTVLIYTELQHEGKSQPASIQMRIGKKSAFTSCTVPQCLAVSSITASSARISWQVPTEMQKTPHSFLVSYQSEGTEPKTISTRICHVLLSGLRPGTDYTVDVYIELQNGDKSKPASVQMRTEIPIPQYLTVSSITASSAKISWQVPTEIQKTPHSFLVSYEPDGTEPKSISTESCCTFITGLTAETVFTVLVYTELQHGGKSQPVSVQIQKGLLLPELLSDLGLKDLPDGNLTLSSVLEINSKTMSDTPPQGLQQLPWSFLKKLIMSNVNARNNQYTHEQTISGFTEDEEDDDEGDSNAINPLDLITALFHCADPFLQQEMVSKMSLCQFAVPVLLPNCDTQQSTLLLWAMRDLVKNYKPLSSSDEVAFVEGRIVEMEIPMVSFVRAGESSLSKSQTLNDLLSNPSQSNKPFIHRNLECGDVRRKISDGLVEVSWYLPCGNKNNDIFTQPVAVANLRGDSRLFEAQVSFLCQISAAVFIFSDDLEGDFSLFTSRERKAELFLVTNSQRKDHNVEKLKETCRKYSIEKGNMVIRKKQNDSDFVNMLCFHVRGVLGKDPMTTSMFNVAAVAQRIGILVDEDSNECQNARKNAEGIGRMVKDVVAFKEEQLPLHGTIWNQISQLEKERYRMRNANKETGIEDYRSKLTEEEKDLRKKQQQKDISEAMAKFIAGISESKKERLYFLKWLNIQLDTLTRHHLSSLRQKYKDCLNNNPQNKELIKSLDEQISNCSLGPEHFFRELGQIYECACSLPQNDPARNQIQHLPRLCAQMLLDGFPVELVDGDTSNIPMKWISDVLTQLHVLVDKKSRIIVLTVLGVQSTGKSTLLNTMFGVQFAVSSGRCTRGAFMLLMKVSEELRPELNCDFIMVIDTEGLKSPELAALDTSYEHDNELATLVIGLSDITIINVAMENNQEMKDVLQIAVHAFLRMKEVGKKPRCLFVHQNVSDMSAHDKNMRDRNKLVEQLNEMTQAAAKMEKKEANTKFTDVMKYDPENDSYYIPGLWHGTPPMAPVNTGYSEAVYELKKKLILLFKSDKEANNDATEFLEWTKSLWNAVKFENFIFNFRNSLVADAYLDLCTHYNSWEWTFQSEMNSWLIAKTSIISNFGVTEKNVQISQLQTTLQDILKEALKKLDEEKQKVQNHLQLYFQEKNSKVRLVEQYRQEFQNSVHFLKQETEQSVRQCLKQAVKIREEMEKVNKIKKEQTETIGKKVLELLEECKKRNAELSDHDLNVEFDTMWAGIKLSNGQLEQTDVYRNAGLLLMGNLAERRGRIAKLLSEVNLRTSGQKPFIILSAWFATSEKLWSALINRDRTIFLQEKKELCQDIITNCQDLVKRHINTMKIGNTDYNDTSIKEILNYIDERIKDQKISDECEAHLKFHIIGCAATQLQEEHNEFNIRNSPQECLQKCKNTFLTSFLSLFHEKDKCLKNAQQFAETCVKPAVQDYVSKHLGQAVADQMKTGDEGVMYNTPKNFKSEILKQLLLKESFEMYKTYTTSYETFVKDWIKDQIILKMSASGQINQLEKKLLSDIVLKINYAITSLAGIDDIKGFIQQFCSHLQDQLVIPRDSLDTFLFLRDADMDQFTSNLKHSIKDIEKSLVQECNNRISSENITKRIEQLPTKPHDLLFSRLCGCGHQCPFCKTPCEAGGQGHTKHFSSMHRSQGLGRYRWDDSKKLVIEICTTLVNSDSRFRSAETNGEWHPYKAYREIYPDWDIAGDASTEASDYWKYVMKEFNKELAEDQNAEPADIPNEWRKLTMQDALLSLKKSFNIK